ncbi:MAG: hypothetical protein GY935_08240 [Gammaproteobacteria bacterium]|nr:hypothetical protein [Gammaproteobacteria bacterium]
MAINRISATLGKCLYAALFVVLVPAFLVIWACATSGIVPLPIIGVLWLGPALSVIGAAFMAAGTWALWVYGHGLPMGPYPPPDYVSRGIYHLVPHPIYLGFVILCVGISLTTESASGLWLVSPSVALGCVALIIGFERNEIRNRFGQGVIQNHLISLPDASDTPPGRWNRGSIILLVLLPWAVAFEAIFYLGIAPDAIESYLPFERDWPVLEWSEAVYASIYLFVPAAIFLAPTKESLRRFADTGLIATAVVTLIYLTVPLIAPPKSFESHSILGEMLLFERKMANTVGSFPAFHVIWAFIAADTWACRSRLHAAIGWIWALLITASCITTGMHALVDLVAAIVLFMFLRNYKRIWQRLLRLSENVANSWWEYRIGRIRFINHGIYAGIAGFFGILLTSGISGPDTFWQLVVVHIFGLIGAGLWAQTLEGSSKLSRPYGYYGSVLGAVTATLVVGWIGNNSMHIASVVVLVAPWVQAIGRMRCLVQGCCHGSPTEDRFGIRYWHERSRVCALGNLRGVPLHPTPLYSILSNVVIGVLLLRLWSLGSSYSLIVGSYFILAGVARFAEESYRGEPQTPIVAGLRLYQWMAILSFSLGAMITAIPTGSTPDFSFWFDVDILLVATVFGIVSAIAMGMDFPESKKRFARLAPP